MLYTTYLYKLNSLPKDILKIIITRFPPKSLPDIKCCPISNFDRTYHMKELAPSAELLLRYKKNNNWDEYMVDFIKEMQTRPDMILKLNAVLAYLKSGKDVIFICFEKDYIHCHRFLLAQWFMRMGIPWQEI